MKHLSGGEAIKQSLLDEIGKGVLILSSLDDLSFRRSSRSSSVGAQLRHNLDFLNTFLNGVDVGRIDYTRRERDSRVEVSREYAIDRFETAKRRLESLGGLDLRSMVSVRSEVDPAMWLQSTVVREMEFVLSHTIHHHALIAEKLTNWDINLDEAVGVSPSTNKYRCRIAA